MSKKILIRMIAAALSISICITANGCAEQAAEPVQVKKIVVSSPSVSDILDEKTNGTSDLDVSDAQEAAEITETSDVQDKSDKQKSSDVQEASAAQESSEIQEASGEQGTSDEKLTTISSDTGELSAPSETDGIDVDLTVMSTTAVYGEVYNMMYYPEKYVGKTIKMQGIYSDYFDQAAGKHYYACIIMDATACCSQGIEFIPVDDFRYPDDYPKEGDSITVEGVFDTYVEESGMYCTLRNASFCIDSGSERLSPVVLQ